MSRTTIIWAALLVGLVAPAYAQETPRDCCSHDHPCRLGVTGVQKCQFCHAHYPGENWHETVTPAWQSGVTDMRFPDAELQYWPTDRLALNAHTGMCLSCHDGILGPLAESCRFYPLAIHRGRNATGAAECGTCHDPHLDDRVDGNAKFLHHREKCTDCHRGEHYAEADRVHLSVTGL